MLMKQCGVCKQDKALDEFHRRGNSHQYMCKACRRRLDASLYRANKPRRKGQYKKLRADRAAWNVAYKSGKSCTDCGGIYHHAAMHWDHLPGHEKLADVSELVSYGYSINIIQNEILKCELVCANCHAVRTFNRRTA